MKHDILTTQQLLIEEDVIRRSKKDPVAFRELYEKYFKPIFLFVLHRVSEKDESADITSQVFLKALVNLEHYKFKGLPFSSWLFRIAVNECNDYFRRSKRSRHVVLDETHVDSLYDEMFGDNFQEELRQKLPRILQRLKTDELHLIELRFMEGRPFREVAEILNITETYAKVRTYRILEKMKKLFMTK